MAALAACGSSSSGAPAVSSSPTAAPSSTASTSAAASPSVTPSATTAAITVLVSNDDGVKAPGIDALVQALRKVSGVTVKVVAPLTNQSGTGGKTTKSLATASDTTTASGYPAVGVPGTPADSVNYALDRLNLKPDVVISGVNAGQNLGPVVDLSGTVGAARVGARQGIPSLAVSAGFATTINFTGGADLAVKWLEAERPELGSSSKPAVIQSLNVPSCATGSVRGELTLPEQPKLAAGEQALGPSDCASTATPKTEVAAFTAGYATLVDLPVEPAS
jgi:5'-nucleotidase